MSSRIVNTKEHKQISILEAKHKRVVEELFTFMTSRLQGVEADGSPSWYMIYESELDKLKQKYLGG